MIWNYVIDISYLVVALGVIILFASRGFFSSVFYFGRYIAAAVITYSFGPLLSGFLYDKWIFRWIATPVAQRVENFLNNTVGSVDIEGLLDSLPVLVQKMADTEALSEKYGTAVGNFGTVAEEFSASVSAPLASLISNVLAYVSIFFLSILLLKLVFFLLNKFFESVPVLNTINRIFGALLGVLAAFLLRAGITWLLGVLISLFTTSGHLASLAESSRIFGFFQNLNFFNLFH